MQLKPFRFGPIALTNTATTNLLNPGTTTGGVLPVAAAAGTFASSPYTNLYILLSHIRVVNKTAGAVTFSLWLGATGANAAGTEVVGIGTSVPANSYIDVYFGSPGLRLDIGDFLVGGASANTSLSIQGEGSIGIA